MTSRPASSRSRTPTLQSRPPRSDSTASRWPVTSTARRTATSTRPAPTTSSLPRAPAARLAKQKADKAVADAQSSQNAAVAELIDVHRKFGEQQQEANRLADERNAAQARLDAARNWSAPAGGPGARGQAASTSGPSGDRW